MNEGMEVDLLCLADEKSAAREATGRLQVRRIPIEHKRGGAVAYAYNYSAFILICGAILAIRCIRRRYDLVYIHNMPDVLVLSALVPKALGAKVIIDLHDPMPELMRTIYRLEENSLGVKLMKWLEKKSIAIADSIITVNAACRDIFSMRSCHADKIGVVMNTPDEKIFPFRPSITSSSNNGNGRSGERFVVMFHGSLVERNGLDLALDALEEVRDQIPGIELRIYGRSTPFLERMLERVRARGLEPHVKYFGPRKLEQLVEDISDCDVGVIPNHRNPFTDINTPTRIFEYLSLGRVVIAPRTKGIEDYFSPEALVYFESGDSKDLAEKLKYVYANPEKAHQTVVRGQEVYREHTWQRERATLLQIVNDVVNHRQGLGGSARHRGEGQ